MSAVDALAAGPVSATPPLQPIRPAARLRLLDDGQLADLRAGTLEILEEVGVHCPSAQARGIYVEHGALVDHATGLVRLPADLVVRAMAQAPRGYVMGARVPALDLVLDGSALHCATDGCGVEVVDPESRARRRSTKADVAAGARLADALPSISFYWPIVSAGDHPATAPLHELQAAYENTLKHVQTETVMGERPARYALEIARVMAGDDSRLRTRPPLSSLICTIAPLAQDGDAIEAALVFAGAGLPVGFMSMANAGSTGPASIPGTVVAADAEIVAALVLVQLAFPGAPVYHSLMPGVMNPRSGAHLATALEGEVAYAAGIELAHAWGVPTLAGVFGTDAPAPGWQAAADATLELTLAALLGAETASGLGLLDACTVFYPEQLILDSDIHDRVRLGLARLDTGRSALALDVIREVGPGGTFLAHPSTRDETRRQVRSQVSGRAGPDGTPRDPLEVARERAARLLADHHPEPLDYARRNEIERIVRAADRELGGS